MAGTHDIFDSADHTASSEYSSRLGNTPRYLQIHHATVLSLSGLIGMMDPGGRTVSANGALGNDGHLVEVVPLSERAFTSGVASFDRISTTVECCNTSLSPTWGISAASRTRLARLAVDLFRLGLLGGLTRQFIIGHNEVPGTYATACPGPDMHLDAIVAEANAIFNGTTNPPNQGRHIMPVYHWGPDSTATGDVRRRGGVLIHEFLGPIFPPTSTYAQVWMQEFPPAGGIGQSSDDPRQPYKTDVSGSVWDVLVQSARDRNAEYVRQLAKTVGVVTPEEPAPVVIDYAALAKAVNDDAARRLAD